MTVLFGDASHQIVEIECLLADRFDHDPAPFFSHIDRLVERQSGGRHH